MATAEALMNLGQPAELAKRTGDSLVAVAAAGTTQGTATQLNGPGNLFVLATPAASQQGVRLPANADIGDTVTIVPTLATPLISVYPVTGSNIDLLGNNLPITFATANKNAFFQKTSATNWRSFIGGPV